MLIFFSGEDGRAYPEVVLKEEANIMLSFAHTLKKGSKKPNKRFRKLLKLRSRKK